MTQNSRPALNADVPAIDALLTAAFGGQDEVALMRRLRHDGMVAAERVIAEGAAIIAYAALPRMVAPHGWLALAPVAVTPDRQRTGLGSILVRDILGLAEAPVVVLGDPAYYARFGFDIGRAEQMTSPFPIAYTGVFLPQGAAVAGTEELIYAPAFTASG